MQKMISSAASVVWLFLLSATVFSWIIGADASAGGAASTDVGIAVLVIAFFKVRLVLIHFMELKVAPWQWRAVYEGWVIIVCLLLVALYAVFTHP